MMIWWYDDDDVDDDDDDDDDVERTRTGPYAVRSDLQHQVNHNTKISLFYHVFSSYQEGGPTGAGKTRCLAVEKTDPYKSLCSIKNCNAKPEVPWGQLQTKGFETSGTLRACPSIDSSPGIDCPGASILFFPACVPSNKPPSTQPLMHIEMACFVSILQSLAILRHRLDLKQSIMLCSLPLSLSHTGLVLRIGAGAKLVASNRA